MVYMYMIWCHKQNKQAARYTVQTKNYFTDYMKIQFTEHAINKFA